MAQCCIMQTLHHYSTMMRLQYSTLYSTGTVFFQTQSSRHLRDDATSHTCNSPFRSFQKLGISNCRRQFHLTPTIQVVYCIVLSLGGGCPVRMGCVTSRNENDFDAIGGKKTSFRQEEDALDEVRIAVSTLHHDYPLSPLLQ